MPEYLKDCWYQAAWAAELLDTPLSRTLLETPVVLFRDSAGKPTALFDRCPHRFAPLSAGALCEGAIRCGYHGLAFDREGHCVSNPHGPITKALRVQVFPVIERYQAIWIWMGDADRADPALVPDLSFIDNTPPTARIEMYMPTAANYRLLTDNIMDLSHADYLHPLSLGGVVTDATSKVRERNGAFVAEWINHGCVAPGLFQAKVPSPALCDYWIEVEWRAPAVMILGTAVVAQSQPRQSRDEIYALHNMTPETASSTHYFMCATRRDRVDDQEFSDFLRTRLEFAFLCEDKPMLELQQKRIGDHEFEALKPALLKIDEPAVRVRRRLDALIAAELSGSNGSGRSAAGYES